MLGAPCLQSTGHAIGAVGEDRTDFRSSASKSKVCRKVILDPRNCPEWPASWGSPASRLVEHLSVGRRRREKTPSPELHKAAAPKTLRCSLTSHHTSAIDRATMAVNA